MQTIAASTTTTTTTVTQHWELEKYSRSRSNPLNLATTTSAVGSDQIEWDHYSQPRLALRLESTFDNSSAGGGSSSNASSASLPPPLPTKMLLQVTYDPLYRDRPAASSNNGASSAAAPLLLDSIDLVSFSSREVRAATPQDQLPLKAVYRDAILGLRYLALLQPAGHLQKRQAGEFRRVQAKFTSTAERERFVDAIRVLVPVKPAADSSSAAAPPPPPTKGKKRKSKEQQVPPAPSLSVQPPFATPQSQAASSTAVTKGQKAKRARQGTTATPSTGVSERAQAPDMFEPRIPQPPPQLQQNLPPPNAGFYNGPDSQFYQNPHPGAPVTLPPAAASAAGAARRTSTSLLFREGPLASLLPILSAAGLVTPPEHDKAAALQPPAVYRTASLALLALEPDKLEALLQDALLEEGFEELVKRVKDTLGG
ncbi:hypothetical protein JCM10908_004873 [Rhodotorula pacifica]|uniref:uncharacterized protein n=1 Tax=Rhodotorula pacifica TaxID=1495444 RepID=UPI00317143B4